MIVSRHSSSSLRARTCSRAKAVNCWLITIASLDGHVLEQLANPPRRIILSGNFVRSWFPDDGVPTVLCTDGGPQISSRKFAYFCHSWQVHHIISTPHYPQSNGHAEAAVKAIKTLITKRRRTATWTSSRVNEAFSSGAIPRVHEVAVRRRSCSASLKRFCCPVIAALPLRGTGKLMLLPARTSRRLLTPPVQPAACHPCLWALMSMCKIQEPNCGIAAE